MNIHDRLRKIIKEEGLSISKFERVIGVGQNSVSTCLRRESSISHQVLKGTKEHFPHYSTEWLITGEESKNHKTIRGIITKLRELEQEINSLN